jgi:hypothetical protein
MRLSDESLKAELNFIVSWFRLFDMPEQSFRASASSFGIGSTTFP